MPTSTIKSIFIKGLKGVFRIFAWEWPDWPWLLEGGEPPEKNGGTETPVEAPRSPLLPVEHSRETWKVAASGPYNVKQRDCILCGGPCADPSGLLTCCKALSLQGEALVAATFDRLNITRVKGPPVLIVGTTDARHFGIEYSRKHLEYEFFFWNRTRARSAVAQDRDHVFALLEGQVLLELEAPTLRGGELASEWELVAGADALSPLKWVESQAALDDEVVVDGHGKFWVSTPLAEKLMRRHGDVPGLVLNEHTMAAVPLGDLEVSVTLEDQFHAGEWQDIVVTLAQGRQALPLAYVVGNFVNRWPLQIALGATAGGARPTVADAKLTDESQRFHLLSVHARAVEGGPVRDPSFDNSAGIQVKVLEPQIPQDLRLTFKKGKDETRWIVTLPLRPTTLPFGQVAFEGDHRLIGVCAVDVGTSQHCASLMSDAVRGEKTVALETATALRQDSVVYIKEDQTLDWDYVARPGRLTPPEVQNNKWAELRSLKTMVQDTRATTALATLSMHPPEDLLATSIRRFLAAIEATQGVRLYHLNFSCPPWYWDQEEAMSRFKEVIRRAVEGSVGNIYDRPWPPRKVAVECGWYREQMGGCPVADDPEYTCDNLPRAVADRGCTRGECQYQPRFKGHLAGKGGDHMLVNVVTDEARAPLYHLIDQRHDLFIRSEGDRKPCLVVVVDAGAGTSDVGVALVLPVTGHDDEIEIVDLHRETAVSDKWYPCGDAIDAALAHWIIESVNKVGNAEPGARHRVAFREGGNEKSWEFSWDEELPKLLRDLTNRRRPGRYARPPHELKGGAARVFRFAEEAKKLMLNAKDAASDQRPPSERPQLELWRVRRSPSANDPPPEDGGEKPHAVLDRSDFLRLLKPLVTVITESVAKLRKRIPASAGEISGLEVFVSGRSRIPGLEAAIRSALSSGDPSAAPAGVSEGSDAPPDETKGAVAAGALAEFRLTALSAVARSHVPLRLQLFDGARRTELTVLEDEGRVDFVALVPSTVTLKQGAQVETRGGKSSRRRPKYNIVHAEKAVINAGRWRFSVKAADQMTMEDERSTVPEGRDQ